MDVQPWRERFPSVAGLVKQTTPGRILAQCAALARTHRYLPLRASGIRPLGSALISRIGKHHRLLSMQQAVTLSHIVDVGRHSDGGVHESVFSIRSNVGLHAEVPLVCLLGFMHLWVTLAAAALGGTWRGNQCSVRQRTRLEHQPLGGKGGVDTGQQLNTQFVLFEQTEK